MFSKRTVRTLAYTIICGFVSYMLTEIILSRLPTAAPRTTLGVVKSSSAASPQRTVTPTVPLTPAPTVPPTPPPTNLPTIAPDRKCTEADKLFPQNKKLEHIRDTINAPGVKLVDFKTHSDYGRKAQFGAVSEAKRAQMCTQLHPYVWIECPLSANPSAQPNHKALPHEQKNRKPYRMCTNKSYIADIPCAFVELWGPVNKVVPGAVFDHERTFTPQIYSRPAQTDYLLAKVGAHYKHLGVALFPYPDAKGHFVHETLSRVVWLLKALPSDVMVLAPRLEFTNRYLEVIAENGFNISRILPFKDQPRTVAYAEHIYVAGEWPFCQQQGNPNIGGEPTEYPYEVMSMLHKALVPKDLPAKSRKSILVVDRGGGARRLTEHRILVEALRKAHEPHGFKVEEFGPAEWKKPLRDHIAIFNRAAVVVGPHGAGFANMVFCAEGTAVIEIGFNGKQGMYMDEMYFQLALGLHLRYWLILGEGGYGSAISADVKDISLAVKQAVDGVQPNYV